MNTPLLDSDSGSYCDGALLCGPAPFALDAYSRFRHQKVVTCPDTRGLAEVKLNARWAALTAIFRKPVRTRKELYLMAKKEGVRVKAVCEKTGRRSRKGQP